jgi:hypothetical protein
MKYVFHLQSFFIANFHVLDFLYLKNEFRAKKISVCHAALPALPDVFGRNLSQLCVYTVIISSIFDEMDDSSLKF